MTYKKCIEQAEIEIRKNVLPKTPIKNFIIKPLNNSKVFLGMYKHGSIWRIPILKLNEYVIKREAKKHESLSLYDIILTTILHELGHAIQDYKGHYFDESEAEEFAYHYWDWREVLEIK